MHDLVVVGARRGSVDSGDAARSSSGVKFRADADGFDHRDPVLQGQRQHRHARRQPLVALAARCSAHGDIHRRDRDGLAAGDLRDARRRDRRTRRTSPPTTPRNGHYAVDRRLLHERGRRQRARCTRCADGVDGGERRLRYGAAGVPDQTLPGDQLLGRRRLRRRAPGDTSPPTVTVDDARRRRDRRRDRTNVTVTFSEADGPGVRQRVDRRRSGTRSATPCRPVAYDAATQTATLTPAAPLAYGRTYTVRSRAAFRSRHVAGNTLAADDTWSFTTLARRARARCSLPRRQPATPSSGDTCAVELGVKFRADVAGTITGIRFYKGAGEHRHARRQPVDAQRHAARARRRSRARRPRAGSRSTSRRRCDHGRHDLRRVVLRAERPLRGRTDRLLRDRRSTTRRCTRCQDGAAGGNGVYRYGASGVPDAELPGEQLLGRRAVLVGRLITVVRPRATLELFVVVRATP